MEAPVPANRGLFAFPFIQEPLGRTSAASIQIDQVPLDIDNVRLEQLRLGILDDTIHHLRRVPRISADGGNADTGRFETVLVPDFSNADLKTVTDAVD